MCWRETSTAGGSSGECACVREVCVREDRTSTKEGSCDHVLQRNLNGSVSPSECAYVFEVCVRGARMYASACACVSKCRNYPHLVCKTNTPKYHTVCSLFSG